MPSFLVCLFLVLGGGVLSFQEKPELYSRNVAVGLHLFCVLSAGKKKNPTLYLCTVKTETWTSGRKNCSLTETRVEGKSTEYHSPAKA